VRLHRTLIAFFSMLAPRSTMLARLFGEQRRIVRQFFDAGSLSPRMARRYYPRSAAEAKAFADLQEDLIIREARPGHYFLSVETLQQHSAKVPALRL
jgi:hypothetical protein